MTMSTLFTWVSSIVDADSDAAADMKSWFEEKEKDGEYFGWQKHTREIKFDDRTVKQVFYSGYEKDNTGSPTDLGVIGMSTSPPGKYIWMSDEGTQGVCSMDGHWELKEVREPRYPNPQEKDGAEFY